MAALVGDEGRPCLVVYVGDEDRQFLAVLAGDEGWQFLAVLACILLVPWIPLSSWRHL